MIVNERRMNLVGEIVEHILGLEEGASIIHKRMMVFGNGPNIEMFEFKDAHQGQAQTLQDIGYTHISFYIEQNTLMSKKLNS